MVTKIQSLEKGNKSTIQGTISVQNKEGKSGNYYFVKINDGTGSANTRVFSSSSMYDAIESLNGKEVLAEVNCTEKAKYINIELISIEAVNVLPHIEEVGEMEALKNELRNEIAKIEDRGLRRLIIAVFGREEVVERFFTAPATMMSGYSYSGGLLVHTVRLIRLSKAIAKVYSDWTPNPLALNKDLLVTASILHDVGKVIFFDAEGKKSFVGEITDDSYLGMKIVWEELNKINIPQKQKLMIEHILGSAKGKPDFGSLFVPRTKEAIAFNLMERLDGQMANFEYMLEQSPDAEFSQLFQKTFYLK